MSRLSQYLPDGASELPYREPFLGAGSMFFRLTPAKAVLADANPHVITAYAFLRDETEAVIRHYRKLARRDCKELYYRTRQLYNQARPSAAQAARFLYLNRTCFNGVFRVNRQGMFNVPYGYKTPARFPSSDSLREAASVLANATLTVSDFRKSLTAARPGDFIYLDPPYPALNGTSFFAHYTADRFSNEDQEELAEWFRRLAKRGCLVMMTNADTPTIRRLYRPFALRRLDVTRWVTAARRKHRVRELVIRNY